MTRQTLHVVPNKKEDKSLPSYLYTMTLYLLKCLFQMMMILITTTSSEFFCSTTNVAILQPETLSPSITFNTNIHITYISHISIRDVLVTKQSHLHLHLYKFYICLLLVALKISVNTQTQIFVYFWLRWGYPWIHKYKYKYLFISGCAEQWGEDPRYLQPLQLPQETNWYL